MYQYKTNLNAVQKKGDRQGGTRNSPHLDTSYKPELGHSLYIHCYLVCLMSDSEANCSPYRVVAGIWLYATISVTDNVWIGSFPTRELYNTIYYVGEFVDCSVALPVMK